MGQVQAQAGWICLLVAAVLATAGLVRGGPRLDEPRPWRFDSAAWLLLAAVLAAVVWPPRGVAIWGLAAGGLAALAALWCQRPLLTLALAAGAAAGMSWLVPETGLPFVTGYAAGAWLTVWAAGLPAVREGQPLLRDMVRVAALLSVSAVATALARQGWSLPAAVAGPALLLAAGFALTVAGLGRKPAAGGRDSFGVGLTAALAVGLAPLLDLPWTIVIAFGLGLVAGLLLDGLPEPPPADTEEWWPSCLRDGILAATILGATGIVAFQMAYGLGLSVAALGVGAAGCLAGREERPPRELDPGAVGLATLAVWVLFRLLYERVSLEAGRADLYLHTPMIGLLAGLLGPLAVGLAVTGRGSRAVEAALATTVGLGIPAALTVVLWGQRAAAGTIAGELAGGVLILALLPSLRHLPAPAARWLAALPAAYGTAAALGVAAAVSLAPLSRSSLGVKTGLLLAVLLTAMIYLGLRAKFAEPNAVVES